ncbi:unnamed protein product [Chondrus crispus]|uniref:Uncharacterized protein n=1 Tax=Chondrus crispus TaxID=2769 RepID=R7Q3Q6_CHOCR|nr:unnamed protein product [Chondrus crispus]CDF32478.1 unnamed protein product [Chondrus crispus]|eukprot:XP_005712143.1 unnamed protein product [Chondrus crispus]
MRSKFRYRSRTFETCLILHLEPDLPKNGMAGSVPQKSKVLCTLPASVFQTARTSTSHPSSYSHQHCCNSFIIAGKSSRDHHSSHRNASDCQHSSETLQFNIERFGARPSG